MISNQKDNQKLLSRDRVTKEYYFSFDRESLKKALLDEMRNLIKVQESELSSEIRRQVFEGGKLFEGLNLNYKDIKPFFSRYCEYLYHALSLSITGGALFEFSVLRAIQSCFGNALKYYIQHKISLINYLKTRKRRTTKIDLAIMKEGKTLPIIIIEVKRELDNRKILDEYLKSIDPKFTRVGIIFAAYCSARQWLSEENPENIFCAHFCKVNDYVSQDKYTEPLRIEDNDYNLEKNDFPKIKRYQDDFMERLFEKIELRIG